MSFNSKQERPLAFKYSMQLAKLMTDQSSIGSITLSFIYPLHLIIVLVVLLLLLCLWMICKASKMDFNWQQELGGKLYEVSAEQSIMSIQRTLM